MNIETKRILGTVVIKGPPLLGFFGTPFPLVRHTMISNDRDYYSLNLKPTNRCQRAQGLLEQLQQKLRNNTIPAPNPPPPPPPPNPVSAADSTVVPIPVTTAANHSAAAAATSFSDPRWRTNSVHSVGPLVLPSDTNGNME